MKDPGLNGVDGYLSASAFDMIWYSGLSIPSTGRRCCLYVSLSLSGRKEGLNSRIKAFFNKKIFGNVFQNVCVSKFYK